MPCGTKQPTNRGFGLAAVCASALEAGIIASSKGRASVALADFRMVLREMCFFVMNMSVSCLNLTTGHRPLAADRCFLVHLERVALHDGHHYGRELVLAAGRIAHDRPHQRHILILHATAQSVGE